MAINLYDKIEDFNQFIKVLNYIYSDEITESNTLSDDVLNWIKKEKKNKKIHEKISHDKELALTKWWDICNNVRSIFDHYLEQMRENEEIKVLIVSEAPMLTINDEVDFNCNYLLGEGSVGSYRTVPFESIWEHNNKLGKKPEDYKTSSAAIINLFTECKVAFVDLIPFPLPQISTDLRNEWKERDDSFIISLFENAIEQIGINFSENLKIVFMMPPTTASGIIGYCIANKDKLKNDTFLSKHYEQITRCNDNSIFEENTELLKYAIKLHRQVVMSGAGGPVKKLFINALKD